MKILIVGRTASGKDFFANKLAKQMNLKPIISYTTRPKRKDESDLAHHFISQEEANKLTDRIAETKIGQYEYFITKQMLDSGEYYIIDPIGIQSLLKNTNEIFQIIYIKSNEEIRKKRYNKRNTSIVFDERNNAEKAQFDEFEKTSKDQTKFLEFLGTCAESNRINEFTTIINNEDNEEEIDKAVQHIKSHTKALMITESIILEACNQNIINKNEKGMIKIILEDGSTSFVHISRMATLLLNSHENLGYMISNLMHTSNLFDNLIDHDKTRF